MLFGKKYIITHRYFGEGAERVGMGCLSKHKRVDFQNLKWPWYAVVFVLQGKGTYVDHLGNEHHLEAGSYFQRIPQKLHSTYIDTSTNWQEIFFDFGVKTYEMMLACQMVSQNKLVGVCELSNNLVEQHYKLAQKLQLSESSQINILLPEVISLFQKFFEQKNNGETLIQDASTYLKKNYLVGDKIQDFCREQGVGYESLRKKFKDEMNISPSQYQNMFRMEKAVELLNQTQLNIEQIADELKYCNAFEFSKQFKKFQGISPSQYRK